MSKYKVHEVMSVQVVAARPKTPIGTITHALQKWGVSGLPVVDHNERVIGVVSHTDLTHAIQLLHYSRPPVPLRHVVNRIHRAPRSIIVGQIMTFPAITIGPTATVAEAAQLIVTKNVKRLPVVDERGKLVGIVSRGDLLKVLIPGYERQVATLSRHYV